MTTSPSATELAGSLRQRLRIVADALGLSLPEPTNDPLAEVAMVWPRLVAVVALEPTPDRVWLLHVALTGSFPTTEAMTAALTAFDLEKSHRLELWLTRAWRPAALDHRSGLVELRLATGAVLLDVTNTARLDLHTGIQRVIRSAAPHWAAHPEVVPVAWTEGWQAYRTLDQTERRRVFSWHDHQSGAPAADLATGPDPTVLVVPWRATVVLAESLDAGSCDRLVALARYSGNELSAIGYDLIPALSGDLVPVALSDQFMTYLTVIKHVGRVAAISDSAAAEFRGFAEMVSTQGLPGPLVTTCDLPSPPTPTTISPTTGRPRVLVVGSYEPRKNHPVVLHAAERLWAEGLDFELHLVGGSSWVPAIQREVERLAAEARPVHRHLAVSEDELDAQYGAARATVLLSLHEGYGLPVVESLAAGTPALVSDFGSIAEIAEGGGCVSVDPRDDDAVVDALRRLLTDDTLVGALRSEIVDRTTATWADYAEASWAQLVGAGSSGHDAL